MSDRAYLSIGEVLSLLTAEFPDVTISKIRFLESQGLIDPERTPSGYRKFYETDVERLKWILRQQRENFLPLKVIRGRLGDEVEEPAPAAVAPRALQDPGAAATPPAAPTPSPVHPTAAPVATSAAAPRRRRAHADHEGAPITGVGLADGRRWAPRRSRHPTRGAASTRRGRGRRLRRRPDRRRTRRRDRPHRGPRARTDEVRA